MWFLTHEGVDRYDGKEFKRYKLMDDGEELNSLLNILSIASMSLMSRIMPLAIVLQSLTITFSVFEFI